MSSSTQEYYTQISQQGLDLINNQTLSGKSFITDGWYIALGTGNLIPSLSTTALVHKIYDKNTSGYLGITFGTNADVGRYAQLQVPASLQGMVITELALFNENDVLILSSNLKIDLTDSYQKGSYKTFNVRMSIEAIPADLVDITINISMDYPTNTEVKNEISTAVSTATADIKNSLTNYQLKSEKDVANGYAGLDSNKKISLSELPSLLTKFAVNSGPVDANGEANFLSYSGSVITLVSGITATNASGSAINVSSALTYTNTATSGTLWLYIDLTGSYLLSVNNFYVQPYKPTAPSSAIWLDTSVEPLVAKITTNAGATWTTFNGVIVGSYIISSSNITKITCMDFNDNFYDVKDRVVCSLGTVSGGAVYPKTNRHNEVVLNGPEGIILPQNLPPRVKFQIELDVISTVGSPTVSYNVIPIWANSFAPWFPSAYIWYRVTFETKDGGATYFGYWTQIGG